MSRELGFRYKYGVLGAGAVAKSLIGRLPAKTRDLGPVSAAYRFAWLAGSPIRCVPDGQRERRMN